MAEAGGLAGAGAGAGGFWAEQSELANNAAAKTRRRGIGSRLCHSATPGAPPQHDVVRGLIATIFCFQSFEGDPERHPGCSLSCRTVGSQLLKTWTLCCRG